MKKNKNHKKNENHENIIRTTSKKILKQINKYKFINKKIIGYFYKYIHFIFIFIIAFIFSFSSNIFHLIILLIIITLDGFSIVVFHGCPLTLMEQKYLNMNSSIERTNEIKKYKNATKILQKQSKNPVDLEIK